MQLNKIHLTLLVILSVPILLVAQELRVGGNIGLFLNELSPTEAINLDATFDFIPKGSVMSIETGPQLTFTPNRTLITAPLSFALIFGSNFTVEPSIGAYFRSNGNFAYGGGVTLGYYLKEFHQFFVKTTLYNESYQQETPRGDEYISRSDIIMIRIGYKRRIVFRE